MTTEPPRVIAIGLDGYEHSIARAMMAEGRLPNLAKLEARAATYDLDHGDARETGLAWEHFSTGKDPDAYERWSAVGFDPATYKSTQQPTRARPFLADVSCPVTAFDVPYLDLAASPMVSGMANWGAHDPGVARHARPESLVAEIEERFGSYPASRYIYGFVWPSVEKTAEMADQMTEAMRRRIEITDWLFRERLPDWRLAVTVIAELHSVAEALWHGWDSAHPLHNHPSAAEARRGIEAVYEGTDTLIGRLSEAHPDATIVVFSMHGMGPNLADLLSMVLLPELLYRRNFGRPYLRPRGDWDQPVPTLKSGESWSSAILGQMNGRASLGNRLAGKLRGITVGKPTPKPGALDWMPATRYQAFWPEMDAFALPAFYDGQVRLNLIGREANGLVAPDCYGATLDQLEALLAEARDPVTGASLVADFERPLADDPTDRSETRCDLKILWARHAYAMEVPGIGTVGPVPQRRTGGHTGSYGYAAIAGPGIQEGRRGQASSFDVVPTLLHLIGEPRANSLSGQALL